MKRLWSTDELGSRRALTPLTWAHVTPYGVFDLDMEQRLDLDKRIAA